MKPLLHPSLADISLSAILYALADPVRLAIYAELALSADPANCTQFTRVGQQKIPKSTLSQHFKALREAGLVRSERHGVELHNVARGEELARRFPGLIASIINSHLSEGVKRAHVSKGQPGRRKPIANAG